MTRRINEIESRGTDRNRQIARSMKLSRIIRNRVRMDNRFAPETHSVGNRSPHANVDSF